MSAANLDAIKQKYNFKDISIATWRNPALSVLPTRGGSTTPTFTPDAFSKPYIPTYKVSYGDLPQATDDEESGDEDQIHESKSEGGPIKFLFETYKH